MTGRAPALRYRGINRASHAVRGSKAEAGLADWVAWKWREGWMQLVVHRAGKECAGIGPDPADPGRRTWWCEDPAVRYPIVEAPAAQ